jgi:hypothetical protein
MHVVAVSTPREPRWRWRIVNHAGDIIEESHHGFPSIAMAVTDGKRRLAQIDATDRSVPPSLRRSTWRRRRA